MDLIAIDPVAEEKRDRQKNVKTLQLGCNYVLYNINKNNNYI